MVHLAHHDLTLRSALRRWTTSTGIGAPLHRNTHKRFATCLVAPMVCCRTVIAAMEQLRTHQSDRPARRQQMIIWAAMLCANLMYFVVARLVQPQQARENPTLVTALMALSVCLVATSFAVKGRLRRQARIEREPGLARAGFILALVLYEAAALLGLVVWFTTVSSQYYVPLLIGFVCMLLQYPSREQSVDLGH
jgi:hypothetical protein